MAKNTHRPYIYPLKLTYNVAFPDMFRRDLFVISAPFHLLRSQGKEGVSKNMEDGSEKKQTVFF